METNIDYTINDEIVCVRNHSRGIVKEGELKVALGLKACDCLCCETTVDVGIKSAHDIGTKVYCPRCRHPYTIDGKVWLNAFLFRKLDTLVDISEITEHLETKAPFEL